MHIQDDDFPWAGPYICFVGVGTGGKQKQATSISYPGNFLAPFEQQFGRGFTVQDILAAIPQAQSLFGGGAQTQQVGGFQPYQPQQSYQPPGQQQQGAAPVPGQQLGFTPPPEGGGAGRGIGQPPAPPPPSPTTPGTLTGQNFTLSQVLPLVSEGFPNIKSPNNILGAITTALESQGVDPNGQITSQQLLSAIDQAQNITGTKGNQAALEALPARLQQLSERLNAPPLQTGAQPNAPGVDAMGGLQRLGFLSPAQQFTPQNIREAPTIGPSDVGNAQMNIAPEGFQQYQQDIFKSLYEPVARQEQLRGAQQDRELQAQLAQAGIQSSGAGIGQLQTQRNERQERIFTAAQQASNEAATRAFGARFEQEKSNADLQQAQNLAKAGFDQQAQITNADNILRGDSARAENYLKTMGLNVEAGNAIRNDFLQVLGLQQADLARLDARESERITTALNAWLQQFAALSRAGAVSQGTGTGGSQFSFI